MAGSKERIVTAGAELFRRQGYTGTGIKQIISAAESQFASLYHHFPGGKTELAEEVIRTSGAMYLQLIDALFAEPDPVKAIEDAFAQAAVTLAESDYADACPIATVALEVASTNDRLRVATADVFESWTKATADHFEAAGIGPGAARDLATSVLALLEGAFILARAARSPEPLRATGATAAAAVRTALEPR